ncbi:tetratricopeptide repeat protein [Anoxybacter fermentans]|nr:tetratricopeptide repeat protein [Anoxybacter fermentans]
MKKYYHYLIFLFVIIAVLQIMLKNFDILALDSNLLEEAQIYMDKKEYAKAISILENLLDDYPNNIKVISLLGKAYYYSGEYLKALPILEQAIHIETTYESEKVDIYLTLSSIYHKKKNYDRAIKVLLNGIKEFPNQADLYSDLATEYFAINNEELALKQLEKALTLDPENYSANLNMLDYYLDTNLDKAWQYLMFFYNSGKVTFAVKYREGLFWYKKGQKDKARYIFEEILEKKPNYSRALYSLGHIYFKAEDYDKARMYFENAIKYQTDLVEAYIMLGLTYKRMSDFKKAEKAYLKGLEISPDHPLILYNLGILYYTFDYRNKAIEVLEKYLSISPEDQKAQEIFEKLKNLIKD